MSVSPLSGCARTGIGEDAASSVSRDRLNGSIDSRTQTGLSRRSRLKADQYSPGLLGVDAGSQCPSDHPALNHGLSAAGMQVTAPTW